jgi:modulator of FtsH protease
VTEAYDPAAWTTMYAAVAASATAFAGLLFVALTVNLPRILPDASHVARAREALGCLLSLLVLSMFALMPGQSRQALGVELLAFSMLVAVVSVRFQGQTIRRMAAGKRLRWALRTVPINAGTVAVIISGVSVLTASGGGLYWLTATTLIYFLWSALNAWILVVEAAETSRHGE